jgi:hypothetical protein
MSTTETLLELIRLSPRGDALLSEARDHHRDDSILELLSSGTEIIEDRTASLCAMYGHMVPLDHIKNIPRSSLFGVVAIFVMLLEERLTSPEHDDMRSGLRLICELWISIANVAERRPDYVIAALIVACLISAAMRDSHMKRPLFLTVKVPIIIQSQFYASLSNCQTLYDVVQKSQGLIPPSFRVSE